LLEGVLIVDKVTCIAFLLYHSSKSPDIQEKAIQLLNGDVSIRELKRIASIQAHIVMAESAFKKNTLDKMKVQRFAEEFLLLEV
jgi:transposase-like protein